MTPRYVFGASPKVAKLVYTGGYATVPDDLERAAQEVIGVKLMKATKGGLYHFTAQSVDDGSQQGIRFEDITPNALAVLDTYRLMRAVA
jgi:hypothetical protein